MNWETGATLDTLQKRAELFQSIRSFFISRGLMEVDVPVLTPYGNTDCHLESMSVQVKENHQQYLTTSPEHYMKRLLASGSGDIFYLGKAFRSGEQGRYHQPEFSILEWYRCEMDERALAEEVVELLQDFLPDRPVIRSTYREVFESVFGVNPHRADVESLQKLVVGRIEYSADAGQLDTNDCLDILFSHEIEPRLQGLQIVYDYPFTQAAMANTTIDCNGDRVARRFEVFVDGLELANGYSELGDVAEQQNRLERDVAWRRSRGKTSYSPDESLLAALRSGLPECSGVALGVDRLLMLVCGLSDISEAISFETNPGF
jgi:lysyl-tRNA synthetase class 2